MDDSKGTLKQVAPHVYYIDSRNISDFSVSGVYVIEADGLTLIETGTSLTAPYLLNGIRKLGYKETDIKNILVTHIHLDHAGATGWLVKKAPMARVYVHEKGARHLADPSRLLESATTVYGSMKAIVDIHGEILPVPEENIVPVTESEIDLGKGIILKTFSTPGHATHHLGSIESESGCLFSGEALGHYHPELKLLSPAVAPPGFDLDDSLATIAKCKAMNPKIICFSQFGQHHDPDFVVKEAESQLLKFYKNIKSYFGRGLDVNGVIEEISKFLYEERGGRVNSYNSMAVSVAQGFAVYLRRKGEISV